MNLLIDEKKHFAWKAFGVVIFVGVILILPYLILGKGVSIPVLDNMDSNIAWYKMLADQGKIWSKPETLVQGMVKETPRFSFPSGLNLELALYGFMEPFGAYMVNKILMFLIGFLSMYSFLSYWKGKCISVDTILVALIWATLPFYPHRGISVAGLPIIALAMCYLWEGRKIRLAYGLIFIYGIYSMLVLAGGFAWATALILILLFCIRFKKWPIRVFGGLILWLLIYVVQDYQLIYAFLIQDDFVSHRSEMIYTGKLFKIEYIVTQLLKGEYWGVYYWWGYLPIILLVLITGKIKKGAKKEIGLIVIFAIFLAILSNLLDSPEWVNWSGKIWGKIHSFSLIRFSHIIPFFIFAALGLVLLEWKFPYKKWLIVGMIALNIFPYQYEWRNMVNDQINFLGYRAATFNEFYAKNQYGKLKSIIPDSYQGYFGHVNMHPSVSAFNGLKCIDGYLQNYPLKHKDHIIEVVNGEISSSDYLTSHIKKWGNKCFLQNQTFPDDFDAFRWRDYYPIEKLDYDFDHLKNQLNVHYLISSVPISVDRLELVKRIEDQSSAWDLHLYRIQ